MERTRPPAPLTAEETQQVLKRASQLDRRQDPGLEPALDFAEVERIGIEAGLSREAIQRAFVEMRAGALREASARGALDRLVGPPSVEVRRLLPDPPEATRKQLHRVLKEELLHPEQRTGAETIWSAAPGLWAAIQRGLDWHGQGQWKGGTVVSEVAAAPPGAEAQSVVRLSANPGGRARYLTGALVPAMWLFVVGVVSYFAPQHPPQLPLVFGATSAGAAGLGMFFSRLAYRKRLRSLRQALERVIDKLGEGGQEAD
jgi:hypothetical protein